jgi:hypothetical protein
MSASSRPWLLVACCALAGPATRAGPSEDAAAVLARAARFYEDPGSKEPGLWRLAWLGTSDLGAVDQARRPVETMHAVHSARPTTRAEVNADLDLGN